MKRYYMFYSLYVYFLEWIYICIFFRMDISAGEEHLPPIECEIDKAFQNINDVLFGRRVVNLGHLLREYEKIVHHSRYCTMGRMQFVKETRNGLVSQLYFYCDNCEKERIICTDPEGPGAMNMDAIWGSTAIGIGHSQCEEFLGVLDVPFMSVAKYNTHLVKIKNVSYLE